MAVRKGLAFLLLHLFLSEVEGQVGVSPWGGVWCLHTVLTALEDQSPLPTVMLYG